MLWLLLWQLGNDMSSPANSYLYICSGLSVEFWRPSENMLHKLFNK